MLRSFKPGIVKNVPGRSIINELKRKYSGLEIMINVEQGMSLSADIMTWSNNCPLK